MEFNEYVATLRKRWFVVAVVAILAAVAGYLYSHSQPQQYRAESKLFLSLARGDTVGDLVQGSTYTGNLVQSFVQLATMPIVLDPTIRDLGLGTTARELSKSITVDSPVNTVIIVISATSTDPKLAAEIANSVADNLSNAVADVSPTSTEGAASVKLNKVSEADVPPYPFAPNTKLATATGLALGLVLGIVVALLMARLDTRVRTARDVPSRPERVILGGVPEDRSMDETGAQALLQDPHGPVAESYRKIRTSLEFLDVATPAQAFVVTSAVPGEGKSTTALHLAMTFAEKGKQVLLIDADMRRPSVARRMDVEDAAGLSTFLVGDARMQDVIQHWSPRLDVMTSGVIPPNPGQLIDSEPMIAFIDQMRDQYDLVVFDTPPLLAVSDAAVLARHTDGAVVVVGCNLVRKHELSAAMSALDAIDANCLGVVVNRVKGNDTSTYSYHYYSKKSAPVPDATGARRTARGAERAARAAARSAREDHDFVK